MTRTEIDDIERLERLEETILELGELAVSGAIIIVEGRKDEESLRYLGIKGEIKLVSHQPLHEFADTLSDTGKEIVILTDWDRKGSLIAKKLIQYLNACGIIPNTGFRSRLRSLSKKRIKDIESLNNYINKLRFEIHGITML